MQGRDSLAVSLDCGGGSLDAEADRPDLHDKVRNVVALAEGIVAGLAGVTILISSDAGAGTIPGDAAALGASGFDLSAASTAAIAGAFFRQTCPGENGASVPLDVLCDHLSGFLSGHDLDALRPSGWSQLFGVTAQLPGESHAAPTTAGCPVPLQQPTPPDIQWRLLQDTQRYLDWRSLDAGEPTDLGLRRAWQQFFDAQTPLIHSAMRASGIKGADWDDCFQEVWLHVIRRLTRFRDWRHPAGFTHWIWTLTRNKIVDFIRCAAKRSPKMVGGCDMEAFPNPCYDDPSFTCQRQEGIGAVHSALTNLQQTISAKSYQVLYLRCIEGQTATTVAAALDLSQQQVSYRLHRAKARLRRILQIHGQRTCPL